MQAVIVNHGSAGQKCESDKKEAAKKARRDLEARLKRDERNQKHLKEVAKIEDEIEGITQSMKDIRLESEQQAILKQKRADLAAVKNRAKEKQDLQSSDPLGIYEDDDRKPSNPTHISAPSPRGPTNAPQPQQSLQNYLKSAVEHKNLLPRPSGNARRTKKMHVILL